MRIHPGFTMIELVMVILLMAVLSAAVFTSVRFFPQAQLEIAADKVSSDLRYARDLAVSNVKWYGVSFAVNPSNQYYVFFYPVTGEVTVYDPAKFGASLSVDLNAKYGCTIQSANFGSNSKLYFDAWGTPYNGFKGAALSADGSVVLEKSGQTKTVYVTPNTGRVRVQ